MRRVVAEHLQSVTVIVGFMALSVVLGLYTLQQQRLQLPGGDRYEVRVDFDDAPGLAPGLGQPATVAGVEVGQIDRADVVAGRARVTLSIERGKLPRVYANATAALVPNTPLQDLQVDLRPGGPPAQPLRSGAVIGLARTQAPIGADRLIAALDTDTRQYLRALLTAAGAGLDGRGPDLRALLRAVGPTARQARELSTALTRRRAALRRTVHSLSTLAVAVGEKDGELRRAVDAGARTLTAMADEDVALRDGLAELPGTLAAARGAVGSAGDLGDELRPAVAAVRPAVQTLGPALRATDRLAATATPRLRRTLRPLAREGAVALLPLPAATADLRRVTPDLDDAFGVLRYLVNELFWTDGGRQRGYPFWFAWAQHNANSVLSTGDAHGAVVRSALIFSCSTFQAIPQLQAALDGVTALLPDACPKIGDEG